MTFFQLGNRAEQLLHNGSLAILHEYECAVCPLNKAAGLCHPKMKPYGNREADVYILGEAPGKVEDQKGIPFIGPSGELLKRYLPDSIDEDGLRWNNVIRCWPPTTPNEPEIEACRPSLIRDIEKVRPQAIIGFGNVPLGWMLGEAGILNWSGRRVPVRIGEHTCWYYPIMHPSYVLRERRFTPWKLNQYGCAQEFAFALHVRKAFREISKGLPEPHVYTAEEMTDGIEIITGHLGESDLQRVAEFLDSLSNEEIIGIDYESNAFRPYHDETKLISVALAGTELSMGIALNHKQAGWNRTDRKALYELLRKFLYQKRPNRKLVSHHLPFELEWTVDYFGDEALWNIGWGDTEGQAYILDERPYMFSLNTLTKQYLGLGIKSIYDLDRANLDNERLEDVLLYNGVDAKAHRLLYLAQEQRLREERLTKVYAHQVERTIAAVHTQIDGIPINPQANEELFQTYTERLQKIGQKIETEPQSRTYHEQTGRRFLPGSVQSVHRYLRQILRKNVEQVNEATLKHINDPLIKLVRRWRRASKILSTYIKPVRPDSPLMSNGLLHPIISTTKTRTWRTSSEDPNIQNWPKRDPVAIEARRQAYAGSGSLVVAFDFASIQARNVAMESQDPTLVKYFWNHYDIHGDWTNRIEQACPGWLKKEDFKTYRHYGKNKFVFPSFFGAQPASIAANLGLPEDQIAAVQKAFWREFPGVKKWQERLIADYYRTGYVTGLSGFRRRAPVQRNELVNSPIQSDESLIVCDAWVRISKLGLAPIMEIHDDLTFIWPKKDVDGNAEIVIREMCRITFPWINVPLGVEMLVGPDWASLKPAGEFESKGDNDYREIRKKA